VPDPLITAASQILDGSLTALRGTVEGLEPDALNWRPGDETNTVAVLVTHAVGSTRWWLSVAMAQPLPERDRASEFLATTDSPTELLAWYDGMGTRCRSLLDAEAPFDADAIREVPARSTGMSGPVTAAWALLFCLGHLQEHVAHAQMTRQLWEQRPA
jgi:DinB superfamily